MAGWAAALAVLAAGAGGLAFQLGLPSLLPSPLDWQAAGVVLERDARPGDAILTSPGWAERIRMLAPRGMRVLEQPRAGPVDVEGVRRIWLVSLPRAPGFSWRAELDLLALSATPDPALAVGRLELGRYELTHPDLPLATLVERLPGASVRMGGRPCPAQRGSFQCSAEGARVTLAEAVAEVNGIARECVVLRAAQDTGSVLMTFEGVPMGRILRGNVGALPGADVASSRVTLVVRIEGAEAAAVELEAGGWSSFRVDTSRWAGEKHAVGIELVVPRERALCLQAATVR